MRVMGGRSWLVAAVLASTVVAGAGRAPACPGDCNDDGRVSIDELVRSVRVALGLLDLELCTAADPDGNGMVSVDELVRCVDSASTGCLRGPAAEILFSPHSNQLDVYDLERGARDVLIPSDRNTVNGQACALPDGSGNFVVGDDTGQPEIRPGWSVFSPDGLRLKKLPLPERPGEKAVADPIGCAFDAQRRLFTTAIGAPGGRDGQLIVFFPPLYDEACILDQEVGTPGTLAVDEQGDLYVPEASPPSRIARYVGPFPSSPEECEGFAPRKETFIEYDDPVALLGIARGPGGHWFVSSVVGTATVREHDADGVFLRDLFEPGTAGSPAGVAVDSHGTVYYADLGLDGVEPAPGGGSIRQVRFDAEGEPLRPGVIRAGLSFPDAVAVLTRPPESTTYGGDLRRLFYYPDERLVTRATAPDLIPKWRYLTSGIVSGQPAVAWVRLPAEGLTRVVYATSWDGNLYALRVRNGSQVWHFTTKPHPGGTYPYASSPTVAWLGDRRVVYFGGGMTMYCVDAATGELVWEFDAGTGCTTCNTLTERNQVESSPAVFGGFVYFGMDVNDIGPGKGGLFAVAADDGRLAWYFDLETGATCRPLPDDDVRRFDGFHTAEELGLPEDFFATRPGCDFDRSGTACGNVWSSASIDPGRGLLYIASSNCDTDDDPETLPPPPPMPPYDRALFAVRLDGAAAWVWRPTEVDNADLSFGGAPNLFSIELGGARRDVVGIGNKNGTYYVIDRDGVNEINGVTAQDAPEIRNPDLPYWQTNVVAGGSIGGIIASAAVSEDEGRVFFSTAPGVEIAPFQLPTAHALAIDDGSVVWQNPDLFASFGPTGAIPGLVLTDTLIQGFVNVLDADDGSLLAQLDTNGSPAGTASTPAVAGGMLFVGAGIGELGRPRDCAVNPLTAYCQAVADTPVSAFCVRGTFGCEEEEPCDDGNPCTYDYREDGDCKSEPAPDTLDCSVVGGKGRCSAGECVPLDEP